MATSSSAAYGIGRRRVGAHPAGVRARCRPRRCACGPGRAAGRPPWCRRTAPSASTPGRACAPRAGTAPWRPPTSIARSVAASPSGTTTPLPAASPSSFHHDRDADARATTRRRRPASVKRAKRGPGMPSSRGERPGVGLRRFEPGERRRSARSTACPRRAHSSAMPAASAASGPGITRSTSAGRRVAEIGEPRSRRDRGGDTPRRSPLRGRRHRRRAPASGEHRRRVMPDAFERQLRLGVADGERVLPGEAGVAVAVVLRRHRGWRWRASSRRATGRRGCRRRCAARISSTDSVAAIRSPSWPMSTPKWQACVIGGHVIFRWTSAAPASRTSFTSGPAVVPRTSESSIITTRLPSRFSRRALNFSATPRSRMSCVGSMNVRPM